MGEPSRRDTVIEFRILVPAADNDGQPFSPEHHRIFESEVLRRFGGFTLVPGTVTGQWSSEGTTYTDSLRVYVVAVASILDGGRIRALLAWARLHYRQEAMYFSCLGLAEVFSG
jgi:hypothetical protein